MTPTTDEIRELLAKAKKATPGPWEVDSTRSYGSYGNGDDTHEGFDAFQVWGPPLYPGGNAVVLCDTLNSNASSIEEEYGEESHCAWDELGRRNMTYIAACSPDRISALCALALEADRMREAANRAVKAMDAMRLGISIHNDRRINRFVPVEGPVVAELADASITLRTALSLSEPEASK